MVIFYKGHATSFGVKSFLLSYDISDEYFFEVLDSHDILFFCLKRMAEYQEYLLGQIFLEVDMAQFRW